MLNCLCNKGKKYEHLHLPVLAFFFVFKYRFGMDTSMEVHAVFPNMYLG